MIHTELNSGRWFKLSLCEQLGNVGSEVNRALKFEHRDPLLFENAFFRALDLLDLTLADPRWRKRLKEIGRAREMLCAAVRGNDEYNTALEDLNRYFYRFALAARLNH